MEIYQGGCGCSSLGPHELDVERIVPHLAVQAVRMFHQGITHATRCTCTWLHHMCVHILKRFVEVQVWPWACMGPQLFIVDFSCQVEKSDHWLRRDMFSLLNWNLYVFLFGSFQDYIDYIDMIYTRHVNNRIYHLCLLAAPLVLIIPKFIPASCNPWRTWWHKGRLERHKLTMLFTLLDVKKGSANMFRSCHLTLLGCIAVSQTVQSKDLSGTGTLATSIGL